MDWEDDEYCFDPEELRHLLRQAYMSGKKEGLDRAIELVKQSDLENRSSTTIRSYTNALAWFRERINSILGRA